MPNMGYGSPGTFASAYKKKNNNPHGNTHSNTHEEDEGGDSEGMRAMLEGLDQYGDVDEDIDEDIELEPLMAQPQPMTATAPGGVYGDPDSAGYGHGGSGMVHAQRQMEGVEGMEPVRRPTSVWEMLKKRLLEATGMEEEDLPFRAGEEDPSPVIRNLNY